MAEASRVIELIFQAVDNASDVVSGIGSGIGNFSDKVQTATEPLANLTEALLKFEAAAAAGAIALAGFAIKASGDFDRSFKEITTLVSGSEAEFQKFRETLLDTGAKSAFPSTRSPTPFIRVCRRLALSPPRSK